MFGFFDKLLGKTEPRPGLGLALYGPRNEGVDLLKGLDWILEWAARLGLPTAEWVTINYGDPANRQYKSYKLEAWMKRGRPLPAPACTSVEVGRDLQSGKGGMTDHVWYASLQTETHSEFVLVLDCSAASPNDEILTKLISDVQTQTAFEYGYVVRMSMERSSPTYINGLVYGNPTSGLTQVQEDEINKWGNARSSCGAWLDDTLSHYLRDIYPLNILNPYHLSMLVSGQSLKEWIEADASHGTLTPLIEGRLWTWAVPEKRIQSLRKVLGPQRLLVSWGDFNTPAGGPLGHTYGAKPGALPAFEGKPLSEADQRWIAEGLALMKPLFAHYTGEPEKHFDQLIGRGEPLFAKLLDAAFSAWSQDVSPQRTAPEAALQAFAAALGDYLVRRYRMAWYVVEDQYGRGLGVCHRGKGDARTWSYPVDAVAKRIERGETGFFTDIAQAIEQQIKQGN